MPKVNKPIKNGFCLIIVVVALAVTLIGSIFFFLYAGPKFFFTNIVNKDTANAVVGGGSAAVNAESLSYPGGTGADSVDPSTLKDCLNNYIKSRVSISYLVGKGQTFAEAGKNQNINPALMLAIAQQESSLGTTGVAVTGGFNYYGLTNPSDSTGWRRFSSPEEAISYQAKYLREEYLSKGLVTIEQISTKYAPVGAVNDPNNLNTNWVTGVRNAFNNVNNTCPQITVQPTATGAITHIYLHWAVSGYNGTFKDYHYNIHGDGKIVKTGEDTDLKEHTYMRNTGAVGISVSAMLQATPACYKDILGSTCPTPIKQAQLEAMAQLIADLSKKYGIPIDIKHVMTHAEAGDNADYPTPNDPNAPHLPYGPGADCEKWDLAGYGNQIRAMAITKLNK